MFAKAYFSFLVFFILLESVKLQSVITHTTQFIQQNYCPKNWVKRDDLEGSLILGPSQSFTCYKFVRSPKKSYLDAKALCQNYKADLITISSKEEHSFITMYLYQKDPMYRDWYVGLTQKSLDYWENEDGTPLQDVMKEQFLPDSTFTKDKNHLTYSYSYRLREWGLKPTDGSTPKEFICEVQSDRLQHLHIEELRDYEYGVVGVTDKRYLLRGPEIIHQPDRAMFDILKRDIITHISIFCLADGYPAPTYEWFKEEYKANKLQSRRIKPLEDTRFTISGGALIINQPNEIADRGQYFCVTSNRFGKVVSRSVPLSFAYMAEFNLKRSDETGNQNWGKAIYCDPPRFFPDARFYWSRNAFPNLVEEDKRTFVSYDGNLYFSYLDNIDAGAYKCTVQSTVSDIGRHGPLFNLRVYSHPNFQQLKFANNFPKAFPDSPIRGKDVRLECIAFGYPVPSYNWTRRNGDLPANARLENYNRVLVLPEIEASSVGDYVCRARNERLAIDGTVSLSIQAEPYFTIVLHDAFIAEGEPLMLECEAFAIPDVTYTWLKNAVPILPNATDEFGRTIDFSRINATDNLLRIESVGVKDEGIYQCKATNQLASAFSSAELKVLKLAPTFVKNPLESEMFAAISTNITIPCKPEAAPKPDIVWRKDGLRLGKGSRVDILENGDLQIMHVSREDGGVYKCSATNIHGTDDTSGRLIMLDEPYISRHLPEIVHVTTETTMTLRCEAVFDPILEVTYVWSHNELRIEVDDTYEDPYKMYWHDDNYFTDFYARRQADTAFTLEKLNRVVGHLTRRQPPYRRGRHPGHLVVYNLTLEDTGHYMCNAKSPIANISQVTNVIVFGPPGPAGGVSARDETSTTALLQWTDGATNGRPIITHNIEGSITDDEENMVWVPLVQNITATVYDHQRSRMQFELPVKTLSPWATYRFRVQAVNTLGEGKWSQMSPKMNTKMDVPFIAPRNVTGGGGKTGDLEITWDTLPNEDQNAPGIYYRVFWRRYIKDESSRIHEPFKQQILKNTQNPGTFVAAVEPEFFYTEYEVKVQSANGKGWGPTTKVVRIFSAEDMPQVQTTEVKAFGNNATSMNITWRPIEINRVNIRGKLLGYRLKYWREDPNDPNNPASENDAQIRLKLGTEPFGQIVGLVPNTFYWVKVMAYNRAGSGPESEKFRERTWRDAPLTPPNAVEVHPIDPETIFVRWRGITPTPQEEALLGYKVRLWESDQDMTTANDTIVRIGNDLEVTITGLKVGTLYKLRVLAFSLGGDGKMSSPPWHFSMGDPERLRADAEGCVVAPLHLMCLLPFIILLKR